MSGTEGTTSTSMTIVGMVKTSIGTGVLAIPHVYAHGGVASMSLILAALALWNEWCGRRLLKCRDLCGEAPLASLARVAGGKWSAAFVDFTFVSLVLGVVTSYLVACRGAVAPCFGDHRINAVIAAAACLPLTMVRDVGRLAPVGAVGLFCLALAFGAVLAFAERSPGEPAVWTSSTDPTQLAAGFGVLSYCFGIVPIVPQFEASMQKPEDFAYAQRCALAVTALVYSIVGVSVVALSGINVSGNVLDDLPDNSVTFAVRLAVAVVCVASAPVAIVAGAEIAEAKVGSSTLGVRLAIRVIILGSAAFLAAAVPQFALVVSVVGAGGVSFLSFVLPPLVHYKLTWKKGSLAKNSTSYSRITDIEQARRAQTSTSLYVMVLDISAVVFGLVVVVLATSLTAYSVYIQLRRHS